MRVCVCVWWWGGVLFPSLFVVVASQDSALVEHASLLVGVITSGMTLQDPRRRRGARATTTAEATVTATASAGAAVRQSGGGGGGSAAAGQGAGAYAYAGTGAGLVPSLGGGMEGFPLPLPLTLSFRLEVIRFELLDRVGWVLSAVLVLVRAHYQRALLYSIYVQGGLAVAGDSIYVRTNNGHYCATPCT